jgi:nucleoside-diphosphate-sugar epimerase
MARIFVTGGAGFIGYHLTNYLLQRGQEVVIYDNFCDYYSPALKWKNAKEVEALGAKVVQGDILNRKKMQQTITKEGCTKIVHLAAQAGVRYSTINPTTTMQRNVEGTSAVLETANKLEVEKTVIASSSSVFGETQYLPIDEAHPKNPISFYGVSKLTTEQIVTVQRRLFPETKTVIIRPFTVVGARQRPDMAINIFVSKALSNKPITVFGQGTPTRDWTHVENLTQAFYLTLTKDEVKNDDFNIGAGTQVSVNRVLEMIEEITGQKLVLEYQPMNKADVRDTFADISKAKKRLGYHPTKSLYDAIEEFTHFWITAIQPKRMLVEQTITTNKNSSASLFTP